VAAGNPAPDGPEPVFCFAGVGFVDVGDSLAEVVLRGRAVVDALEGEDGLVGVLRHL